MPHWCLLRLGGSHASQLGLSGVTLVVNYDAPGHTEDFRWGFALRYGVVNGSSLFVCLIVVLEYSRFCVFCSAS